MSAGILDLTVDVGATFAPTFTWNTQDPVTFVLTPLNLTGYTARCKCRASMAPQAPLIWDLESSLGTIILGGVAGTIQLSLAAAVSALITATTGFWDLELTDSTGKVTRLLEGRVTFTPRVSV